MKFMIRLTCFLLLLSFALTGCQTAPTAYDVPALVQSIRTQVAFADTLDSVGAAAPLYFADLPEGAAVELYLGSGYYADALALITVADPAQLPAARAAAEQYVAQLRSQFADYIPQELGKIDKAYLWENGCYLVLCISDAVEDAKTILANAADTGFRLSEGSVPQSSAPAEPSGPSNDFNQSYPGLLSQSGAYVGYPSGNLIRVDNSAFEVCSYNDSVAAVYAGMVSRTAEALAGETNVYCLPIPTAMGVVFPDDVKAHFPNYLDQGAAIETVLGKLSDAVNPVRCYESLMLHRDEYLYFRTDHHWNGTGAYYAYEAFCSAKGLTPYTLEQREAVQFEGFLGSLYKESGEDASLLPADTVYAYYPYCRDASMVYYDRYGSAIPWPIISNVEDWAASGKYNTFAGSDQPLAVFTNPSVTDGSVCIVVKESYGNALLPFLVDHYSTIYEIDYRYWSGDLVAYAREVGADDLLFANNLMMISTNILVADLQTILP